MNKFNSLHGDELTEPSREWNRQPLLYHFKYRTSPSKNNPVASAITGRLNHHSINNGNVKVSISEFPVESNSESVPYPNTTPIKSIDNDEMDKLLGFFHSKHDEYLMDVDLQILQA